MSFVLCILLCMPSLVSRFSASMSTSFLPSILFFSVVRLRYQNLSDTAPSRSLRRTRARLELRSLSLASESSSRLFPPPVPLYESITLVQITQKENIAADNSTLRTSPRSPRNHAFAGKANSNFCRMSDASASLWRDGR